MFGLKSLILQFGLKSRRLDIRRPFKTLVIFFCVHVCEFLVEPHFGRKGAVYITNKVSQRPNHVLNTFRKGMKTNLAFLWANY